MKCKKNADKSQQIRNLTYASLYYQLIIIAYKRNTCIFITVKPFNELTTSGIVLLVYFEIYESKARD